MSSMNKKIGEITLRDFKNVFDRPGFFRFHFKAVEQEFGMVKEEVSRDCNNYWAAMTSMCMFFTQITQDDQILPGDDGKIVAWVEED